MRPQLIGHFQISRAGTVITQLDIDDQTASEPASPGQHPSTPVEPSYTFASPALARLTGQATPANSAFHRRARVSGGALVDSPYDPFVSERREDGEPERKRIRRSWGNETRWKLAAQRPSPEKDKDKSKNRWIEDEESEPEEQQIVEHEDTTAPLEPPSAASPIPQRATISQIEEMRFQYTQELVDMVGGDTEEDTDVEISDLPSPNEAIRKEAQPEQITIQNSAFAVFRDTPVTSIEDIPTTELSIGKEAQKTRQSVSDQIIEGVPNALSWQSRDDEHDISIRRQSAPEKSTWREIVSRY
jgi:hypothetical protein